MIYREATIGEYIFCFILLNICFYVGYKCLQKKKKKRVSWFLALVFCLFAFYGSDYFSFGEIFSDFISGKETFFREPFYYELSKFSLNSYTVFRFYIWGTALLLFYKTCQNFKISLNVSVFIFLVFFLLTFSYARASLGMASFFYGASVLITKPKRLLILYKGVFFILFSFFAHRSMLLLIILTPLLYMPLTRKTLLLVLLTIPVLSQLITMAISDMASEIQYFGNIEAFDSLNESAQFYASADVEVSRNWRYILITSLKSYSFYLLFIYILYKYIKKKDCLGILDSIGLIVLIIMLISFILSFSPIRGVSIMSYRIRYMAGIPLCIILSKLYCDGNIKFRTLFILLIPSLFYAETLFLGKIYSLIASS